MTAQPQQLFDTLTFLPTMYPGETLYNWCSRYHRFTGNRLASKTSCQLFGTSTAALKHDLPSHLNEFVRRTEGIFGDEIELCMRRTLLGFYAPHKPAQLVQSCIESMSGTDVGKLKFQLGLPSSRRGGEHPLKACAHCMIRDHRTRGISYWHIEHQWPSVWICPEHGEMLKETIAKHKLRNNLQWLLPDQISADDWKPLPELPTPAISLLTKMARMTLEMTNAPEWRLDVATLHHTFMHALKRKEWLTDKGMIRLNEVCKSFLLQAEGLDQIDEFRFTQNAHNKDGGFIGNVLRNKRRNLKHPVKHLLLMAFLFDDWLQFIQTYEQMQLSPIISNRQVIPPDDPIWEKFSDLVQNQAKTVTEAAQMLGINLSNAYSRAHAQNLSFKRRPRAITKENESILKEALTAGKNREDAAKIAQIPRSAVNRYLLRHPELQSVWHAKNMETRRQNYRKNYLRALKEQPLASSNTLRSIPGNGYTWLKKHDKAWLSENLPSLWKDNA